jgi:hypothetical protein
MKIFGRAGPASVQSNLTSTLPHRLTETGDMGVVMADWRDPRRGEIALKQRQSTSFSHLQCQIVDVHLQSGVPR